MCLKKRRRVRSLGRQPIEMHLFVCPSLSLFLYESVVLFVFFFPTNLWAVPPARPSLSLFVGMMYSFLVFLFFCVRSSVSGCVKEGPREREDIRKHRMPSTNWMNKCTVQDLFLRLVMCVCRHPAVCSFPSLRRRNCPTGSKESSRFLYVVCVYYFTLW